MTNPTSLRTSNSVPFGLSTIDPIPISTPIIITQRSQSEPINITPRPSAEETKIKSSKDRSESTSSQRKIVPIANFNTPLQSKHVTVLGEEPKSCSPPHQSPLRSPSPRPLSSSAQYLHRKNSVEQSSSRPLRKSSEGPSSPHAHKRISAERSSQLSRKKSSDEPSSPYLHRKSSSEQSSQLSRKKSSDEASSPHLHRKISAEQSSQLSHKKSSDEPSTIPKVSISLSTFIDLISDRPTPFPEWRNKVINVILENVLNPDPSSESIGLLVSKVCNESLNYTTMLSRIEMARKLFKDVTDYQLSEFSGLSNPMDFGRKCEEIKSNPESNFNVLFRVVGGEEPFQIVTECSKNNGNQIKLEFVKSFYDILDECKRKESLFLTSSFHFDKNFDFEHMHIVPTPISFSNCTEFKDTFLTFYSPRAVQRGNIRYNNELIFTPSNPNKNQSEMGKGEYFAEWIFSKIQEKTKLRSTLDAREQLKLFALTPEELPKFNRNELKQWLMSCLSENFSKDTDPSFHLTFFFETLQKSKISRNFHEHVHPHFNIVAGYLKNHKGFQKKDWEEVANALINFYFQVYKLEEKRKHIPCLSLYKAITSSNFASGEYLLKNSLCPDLCKTNSQSYELIPDPVSTMYYHISHQDQEDSFQVTHIRPYQITLGIKTKMTLFVIWKVQGSLSSLEYNTLLEFDQPNFAPDCSYLDRSRIWNSVHLNFQENWGGYLSKHEKKVTQEVSFASFCSGVKI